MNGRVGQSINNKIQILILIFHKNSLMNDDSND